jgi:hypothetical protein
VLLTISIANCSLSVLTICWVLLCTLQTYVLPSLTFSRPCRSTLNGICAACGKAGALIGSTVFVFATSRFGEENVMIACSGVSLIGMVITLYFVSDPILDDGFDSDMASSGVPMRTVISKPSLLDYFDTV